jgi:formylglycine-generating enzyme required for sulfatase activity/CheY-like chemotaxis protein
MKILIVDDDAEAVRALEEGLRQELPGPVLGATSSEAALALCQAEGAPEVLITEAVLQGMDGFALREALEGLRPELKTVFVTAYDLSEYHDYIGDAVVLYKPVDLAAIVAALTEPAPAPSAAPPAETPETGDSRVETAQLTAQERTHSARLRRLVEKKGFTGKLDQFDLIDIIQMCCVGKRTGCLQIARGAGRGVLYLRQGQIIDAVTGDLEAQEAAYEIIGWSNGQFSFEEGVQPEEETIHTGWEHLVMEGVRRRDEKAQNQPAETQADEQDPALAGQMVGPYQLRRKIGQGERTQVFEALQTSMARVVALKVLRTEYQEDPAALQTFLALASAKANVQYPSILAVYEAGASEGVYYYAREFVDGANLASLQAAGRQIDDVAALACVKVAAEALSYLNQQKVPHGMLGADDVYIGRDGRTRLNNIAILPTEKSPATSRDMQALSRMVAACLPLGQASTPGLRTLLGRMLLEGSGGFLSWGALLQAVRALEPKVVPEDAFKLSAQDAAAIAAVNDAKRRQKRALIWTTIGMFSLIWLVAAVIYFEFLRVASAKVFETLVEIPAGEFIYQNGERMNLPVFWIDTYEVTIAQYAAFLAALKAHPTTAYDSPEQPKGRAHGNNLSWIKLYEAASQGGTYNGAPVDLNCPAVFVDWFDAYAFAKWKGHRLPTEQEWEKAGRGTDGRRFPWGDDPAKISKVNTSADFHAEDGHIKGEVDGYNRWSPVDAMTGDRSPYGVMDMAGNVSEWTATIIMHGQIPYPVVRGGNFGSQDVELIRRVWTVTAYDAKDRIGFRTVADTPPAKK